MFIQNGRCPFVHVISAMRSYTKVFTEKFEEKKSYIRGNNIVTNKHCQRRQRHTLISVKRMCYWALKIGKTS